MTNFQRRVYDALLYIPKGKVTTYKLLAQYLCCNSAQAIGQALKRNLYAPEIPCHRVVKSDLSIGGYSGHISGEKINEKMKRLREEGVVFNNDQISSECVYSFLVHN